MRPNATAVLLSGALSGLLVAAGSASAEQAGTQPPAAQQRAPLPDAPVGHRQPQAKAVAPVEMPPADSATHEFEKALEKKLTICRGC